MNLSSFTIVNLLFGFFFCYISRHLHAGLSFLKIFEPMSLDEVGDS